MTSIKNTHSGYIGLLALLIVVTLLTFLSLKQFEKIGTRNPNQDDEPSQENTSTPIDRALKAKAGLEARDRNMIDN